MLTSRSASILLLLAVLLAAGFAGAGFGSGNTPVAAGYVATVDLARVLSAHKGLAAQQEEVQALGRTSQEKLDALRDAINVLRGQLMVYAKGSQQYNEKKWELDRKKLELEQTGERLTFDLEKRKTEILQDALAEIEEKVGKYALEHGIDLVTAKPYQVTEVQTANPQDILKWLSEVDVVWANDALDITDAVITIVNGS